MTPKQYKEFSAGTPADCYDRPFIEWLLFVPAPIETTPPGEPTPEEIAATCAAIRDAWSPHVRKQRERDGGRIDRAELQTVTTSMFGRSTAKEAD